MNVILKIGYQMIDKQKNKMMINIINIKVNIKTENIIKYKYILKTVKKTNPKKCKKHGIIYKNKMIMIMIIIIQKYCVQNEEI